MLNLFIVGIIVLWIRRIYFVFIVEINIILSIINWVWRVKLKIGLKLK